ncbi:porin [Dechloromonas hortensis]|uniref:porin n=1 Tax=Dechloromonas hortensis TaxID=337779 RepID=UPI0012921FFD|nr:porin [Dechloromonas hortensis]
MQKKIIALAVAGLASTAAFAQSNVTIYGSVDAGYAYRWDAENKTTGQHSRSSLDTGASAGNRLGFKGVEDLGNGLKAVFLLEQGFSFDGGNSGNAQGGRTYGRQAYVGLTGGFGTAIAGRLYTPYWTLTSGTDPFAAGTVGQMRNVFSSGAGLDGLLDPARVDNAVAYVSPSFGGFDVTVAYANAVSLSDAANQENAGDNSKNNTVYALLAKYSAGPVMAGFNVHRIAVGSTIANTTAKSVDNYTLAGTFDAKVVKLHAMAQYNVVDSSAVQGDFTGSNYMLGATVPLGKFALKTSVTYSDFNGDANSSLKGTATQYAFGADYALSKRTNLYSAYSLIDSSSARAATIMGMNDAQGNGGVAATGNPFQQGIQVGVRHQF